jgi:hypothetical protein
MDQLLLQPVRCLGANECFRPNSGRAGAGPMKLVQLFASRRRRSPRPCGSWNGERGSDQRRPYRARSWVGNQMEPEREGPSVRECTRWPGARVMMSPAHIVIPPQIGAGRSRLGNETRIRSAGTATKAIRDSFSSAADRRMRCSVTWVSRAPNWR